MTKKVAIIIPTLNERNNILEIIHAFRSVVSDIEIIIADSSSDGTDDVVRQAYLGDNKVVVLKCGRLGRGGAVKKGYEWVRKHSQAEFIVVADADGSHEPRELTSLLITSGKAELVIGSRYIAGSRIVGWPWYRHVFSRAANLSARLVLRAGVKDYTNGYRVFHRKVIDQFNLDSLNADGYIMLSQELYQVQILGGRVVEVPTTFVNRQRGKSNFHLGLIVESGIIMARLWMAMQKTRRRLGPITQDQNGPEKSVMK
jgi:dolichol-phosphate mannosyltransferase